MFAIENLPSRVSELLQDQEVGVELLVAVNHESAKDYPEVLGLI